MHACYSSVLVYHAINQITFDLSAVVRNDIVMYSTRGEGGNNVKRAISLAAQGRLQGDELVTHIPIRKDLRSLPGS